MNRSGGFSSQTQVTRGFDVFFDLHLNKRLSKQSRRLWFHRTRYDVTVMFRFCITILYDKQLNSTSGRRLPVQCEYYFGCQRLRMWLYNTLDENMAVQSKTTNFRYRPCPLCHGETTSPGNETYRKSIKISILRLDSICVAFFRKNICILIQFSLWV